MRLNVSCPEAMIDDANDLAMALGEGPADAPHHGRRHGGDDETIRARKKTNEAGAVATGAEGPWRNDMR